MLKPETGVVGKTLDVQQISDMTVRTVELLKSNADVSSNNAEVLQSCLTMVRDAPSGYASYAQACAMLVTLAGK